MTLKGGSSQACASCRHRRRKCTPECLLAPYFPPDQQKLFQNAHRLFGVRNIVNILKEIDPSQKGEAMRSIICEANIRETYPVGGCCWVIQQLSLHIQQAEEELLAVRDQLAHYRRNHDLSSFPGDDLHLGPDHLGQLYGVGAVPQPPNGGSLDPAIANKLESKDNIVNPVWAAQHINNVVINNYLESKDNIVNPAVWAAHQHNNNAVINNYLEPKDNVVNPVWAAQHDDSVVIGNAAVNCVNDGNNFMALQTQSMALDPMALQQQHRALGYDERHDPFFDTIDDRQSYIDSKDAYKSSSESSLKDTMQSIEHVAENELKSAAACFSLTSVN